MSYQVKFQLWIGLIKDHDVGLQPRRNVGLVLEAVNDLDVGSEFIIANVENGLVKYMYIISLGKEDDFLAWVVP